MRRNFGQGNMGNMMKQMQEMQKKLEAAQKEIEETVVKGSAGGGMVEVEANGKKEILSVKIKPEVVDPEDVEMLEDMILTALNDAIKQAEKVGEDKMGRLTGGLNIPGL